MGPQRDVGDELKASETWPELATLCDGFGVWHVGTKTEKWGDESVGKAFWLDQMFHTSPTADRGAQERAAQMVVEAVNSYRELAERIVDLERATPVELVYTNWKGETRLRKLIPITVWEGRTAWHPEKQWLLYALDVETGARKDFALDGFKGGKDEN